MYLVPEGDQCDGDPCGTNSGCRVVNGQVRCFCLPGYEGNPPHSPCTLPTTSCDPSPCGPNTRCSVLENGFAKCTCLPGYIESPNTIRGCVPKADQCEFNPCGFGARCNSTRVPPCYCPDLMIGNPYKSCGGKYYCFIYTHPLCFLFFICSIMSIYITKKSIRFIFII